MMNSIRIIGATFLLLFSTNIYVGSAQLSPTFYNETCPDVLSIVSEVVEAAVQNSTRAAPLLLRLHFHDCFVTGCDASILLDNDTTNGIVSEKDVVPNQSIGGYEIVDQIKERLENACQGVVSCADILAIAAQVAVSATGGPTWEVALGRRDSRFANSSAVIPSLPAPFDDLATITAKFNAAGLNESVDIVSLSGGHTFGHANCTSFTPGRFTSGLPMNATLEAELQAMCNATPTNATDLDQRTPNIFDNNYFANLQARNGILQSDQLLFSNSTAEIVEIVNGYADNQTDFFEAFILSMVRMGNFNVSTGDAGEVRLNCRAVNDLDSNVALLADM